MKKYPNWNDVLQSKNEYDDLFDNPDSPKIPYQKKEAQANQISKPLPIKEQNKKEPLVQDGNRLISEEFDQPKSLAQDNDIPTSIYYQPKKKSGFLFKFLFLILFLYCAFYMIHEISTSNETYNDTEEEYEQTSSAIETDSQNAMTHMPGRYYVNFLMAVHDGPSSNNAQTSRVEEGSYVQIVETTRNTDGSYWGQLSTGGYVCIQDSQYTYLTEA